MCPGAVAALTCLALLAVLGCGAEPESRGGSDRPRPVVEVMRVEPGPLRNVVKIPGQLAAAATVVLKTEREGVLESIAFEEGAQVKRGQALFQLRNDEEEAILQEALAELALAEATYGRRKALVSRNVASEAELERAAAERDVAAARVERVRVDLSRMTMRAPFDGVVGALLVAPGEALREQTEMVRIDAIDRLQLLFALPESALRIVRVGAPVNVRVAPYPDDLFPGEVYFVSPSVDAEARRVQVKAWIPNPDQRLRPGLFAEIEAEIANRDDALRIPESALVFGLEGTRVWVVDGEERVAARPVVVGLRQEGLVEITEGLAPGEVVVSSGVHKVSDGELVRAVPAASVAAEPPTDASTAHQTDEDRPAGGDAS